MTGHGLQSDMKDLGRQLNELHAALSAVSSLIHAIPVNEDLVGGTNDPTLTRAEARDHCALQLQRIEKHVDAADEFIAELAVGVAQATLGL